MMYKNKTQNKIHKQAGLTAVSWLLVLVVIGTLAVITMRLFSPYMEGYLANQAFASLKDEPNIKEKSLEQIKDLLQRRFEVNDIKRVKRDALVMTKTNNKLVLQLDYEIRVHEIWNIDAVVQFSNTVEVM